MEEGRVPTLTSAFLDENFLTTKDFTTAKNLGQEGAIDGINLDHRVKLAARRVKVCVAANLWLDGGPRCCGAVHLTWTWSSCQHDVSLRAAAVADLIDA